MNYCSARHQDGWYCVLAEKHKDQHLSMNNQRLWKGTPGFPLLWGEELTDALPREKSDEFDPTLTQGEYERSRERQARKGGWATGDLCDVCGQPEIVRESACRTRCKACGAIDGGCG